MTSDNHAERQAGVIILSQLKMFNEAAVVFETLIQPAFWKGFDLCIARFAKKNEWECQLNFSLNDYCWLAPKHWKVGAKKWKCWFETHTHQGDGVNYNLAAITGVGVKDAQFGFCFEIQASHFGGSKKLDAHINNLDPKYRTTLVNCLDFDDLSGGRFFLPVNVDLDQVIQCWQEFGKFPEDHEVFASVRDALEKLQEAVYTFDAMFLSSPEESNT
ncbi:hypothetical protein [Candidatus Symbiopectobacterium sp. NZEC135]|uniref:hypothetical protein n=1 Tax=Candidatus Symbiopectobacterium sp. NZEC135 TaxID=2820471 RepID=UPI002227141F|nr:hypothetical protein [Candidatus Symbiopectobacterium sp. NZEC135]MCW2481288.1 hypothetical protein [Candidatus Symbiopectobacterium sp. NZEC135]